MFTGIIHEIGTISEFTKHTNGASMKLKVTKNIINEVKIGESVAIDGACHSIVQILDNRLEFFSSDETLNKTITANYINGTLVNIELPLRPFDRIGGHFVSGHIDCVGLVHNIIKTETFWNLDIKIPSEFIKYCISKGSISINGVSLTVNSINKNIISLCIIPITLEKTNIKNFQNNLAINLEFDLLGKYALNINDK